MGYGHRRRSHRGFAIYLGVVARSNLGIVAAKPDSAHRKPGVAPTLRDPGFLQQRQRSAAGADKNEFGLDIPVLAAVFVPNLHTPKIPITAQILHSIEKLN